MKVTFPLLLFTVFLVLKLTHVIDWSWWWITAPVWVGFAIWAVCMAIVGVLMLFESPEDRKRRQAVERLKRTATALRRS